LQRRAVAIATTLTLLCVGFLANRHEAEVAHVREHSGRVVHAQELGEHHEVSASAHLHGREVHEHAGDCSLRALAHERITLAVAVVVATPVETTALVAEVAPRVAYVASAKYRIAPKTSPPTA
jgi:hypothetical protein